MARNNKRDKMFPGFFTDWTWKGVGKKWLRGVLPFVAAIGVVVLANFMAAPLLMGLGFVAANVLAPLAVTAVVGTLGKAVKSLAQLPRIIRERRNHRQACASHEERTIETQRKSTNDHTLEKISQRSIYQKLNHEQREFLNQYIDQEKHKAFDRGMEVQKKNDAQKTGFVYQGVETKTTPRKK